MGLIDRFTALIRRQQQPEKRTTSDELVPIARPSAAVLSFSASSTRRAIIQASREMYDEDTRPDGVIHTVARDSTKGGFEVIVNSGPQAAKAQRIADDLIKRLKLFQRLDDWTRLTLRDGDSFLELSVDAAGDIAKVTRKPTLEMRRDSDEYDRFADPTKAYWWGDAMWQAPPADAIWFADWQIVHARWDHDEGSRYGRPLFASARKAYKRVTEGELDMAVRRKTRAGVKYNHVVEGASEDELDAYRERNQDALDNPFAAVTDFFTNKAGTIQAIQGDANLGEITDVMHHIRTFWLASPVPMSLLGYGQDLNRDIVNEQQDQYDQALESIVDWVADQLVVPLVEMQWLLHGIWPGGLDYSISWKNRQERATAELLKAVAEAILQLQATNLFDDEFLLELFSQIVPNVDLDRLLTALEELKAQREAEAQRMMQLMAGAQPPGEEGDNEEEEA